MFFLPPRRVDRYTHLVYATASKANRVTCLVEVANCESCMEAQHLNSVDLWNQLHHWSSSTVELCPWFLQQTSQGSEVHFDGPWKTTSNPSCSMILRHLVSVSLQLYNEDSSCTCLFVQFVYTDLFCIWNCLIKCDYSAYGTYTVLNWTSDDYKIY